MTWKEAYKKMKQGKRITRKSWLKNDYLYLDNGVLMCDGGFDYLPLLKSTVGKWKIWKNYKTKEIICCCKKYKSGYEYNSVLNCPMHKNNFHYKQEHIYLGE